MIDGNGQGVIFARESADNVVEHNVISNSVLRWNIEDWELSGAGNVARGNCVWTTRTDSTTARAGSWSTRDFTAADNLIADPLFVDRAAKDFRLARRAARARRCWPAEERRLRSGPARAPGPAPAARPQPARRPRRSRRRAWTLRRGRR